MKFEVKNHLLYQDGKQVNWKQSPNCGGEIDPELIVIHYTGDNGLGGLRWLCENGSGVSAHLWIAKTGVVWQLLPFNRRAWHAGRSEWDGRGDCNTWSIGIELQGIGDEFPQAQIDSLVGAVIALHKAYPITATVGHSDVCIPFGRKVDPGPVFPWEKLDDALGEAGFG